MLYDNWPAILKVTPPAGNMPIWGRQASNTQSGADTWRCVSCHGWDYQGKDGAYHSGTSNYTGFPGVYSAAQTLSQADLVDILSGKKDAEHDFSKYLDAASLNDLSGFIKTSLIDDSQYIDPRMLSVIGGDAAKGKIFYDSQCAKCHGADGTTLKFRFQGRDATLGTLAIVDPWRFLHKTRFGTPGTPMIIGYDLGWTAQDGRDVLLYGQGLPTGLSGTQSPATGSQVTPVQPVGGPAQGIFTGILTAIGAIATGLGFAIFLGAFLIAVIFLLVWLVRGRSK
jgi:thiosulfate dehydrogenase